MKRWLVITPTLGESPYFDEAVASVRALGPEVCHRIVAPAAVGEKLKESAPGAEWCADEGAGVYAAIQRAADDAARFAGVTWLNDDDRLIARGTVVAWQRIEAGADIVYGRVGLMNARGQEMGELPVCRRGSDLPALLGRGIVALAQPGTWLSGAGWAQLGGVDPTYRLAGDLDLFWRAAQAGICFDHVPMRVARFRLRAGQLSQQERLGAEEKARVLRDAHPTAAWAARLRFRVGNLGVYADRIRRHGWTSMAEIYRRGGAVDS